MNKQKILHHGFESLNLVYRIQTLSQRQRKKIDIPLTFQEFELIKNLLYSSKELQFYEYPYELKYFTEYGCYYDVNLLNLMNFIQLLENTFKNKITLERRTTKQQESIVYSYVFPDGRIESLFNIKFNSNQPEKFGYLFVQFHGKFVELMKYLNKNILIQNYFKFLSYTSSTLLTRVDYFFDRSLKLQDSIQSIHCINHKPRLYGMNVYIQDGIVKAYEDTTVYYGHDKKSIIIRDYNKYYDSIKKNKLYLYPYLKDDSVRRLEIQLGPKYINKIKRNIQNFSSISIFDFIKFLYSYLQNINNNGRKLYQFGFIFPEFNFGPGLNVDYLQQVENELSGTIFQSNDGNIVKYVKNKSNKQEKDPQELEFNNVGTYQDLLYFERVLYNKIKFMTDEQVQQFFQKFMNIKIHGFGNSKILKKRLSIIKMKKNKILYI